MNDGNTAIQVSPIVQGAFNVEDPMSVRSFFEQIANTVVDASELSKEVARLRAQLQELAAQIESVRNANFHMDQEISELREQRDNLRRDSAEKGTRIGQLELEARNYEARTESLLRQLEQAASERDQYLANYRCEKSALEDAQMKAMELEDANKDMEETLKGWEQRATASETKLAALKEVFGSAFTQ